MWYQLEDQSTGKKQNMHEYAYSAFFPGVKILRRHDGQICHSVEVYNHLVKCLWEV